MYVSISQSLLGRCHWLASYVDRQVPAVQADPSGSHQRVSHQGLGLRATEGPLRSRPKATYVPSWTWQALRVTSQPDLRLQLPPWTLIPLFPTPSHHRPKRAQFSLPHQRIPFIKSSKAVPLGPSTTYGSGEERREAKHSEYLLCSLSKGTLFAEGDILCPHVLFSLGLKQFDEVSLDPFQYHKVTFF